MDTNLVKDLVSAERELGDLEKKAMSLINQDKYAAADEFNPRIRTLRKKVHTLRDQAIGPQPWGDLFDINQVPRSELWQVVANHLSGRQIDLYMNDRELYDTLGVWGGARKIDQKRASIQISDNVAVDGKFWGLLHEAAHIRLDHTGGNIASQESEANTLAAQWREFAEKNANRVGDHRQLKYEALLRACLLIKLER